MEELQKDGAIDEEVKQHLRKADVAMGKVERAKKKARYLLVYGTYFCMATATSTFLPSLQNPKIIGFLPGFPSLGNSFKNLHLVFSLYPLACQSLMSFFGDVFKSGNTSNKPGS